MRYLFLLIALGFFGGDMLAQPTIEWQKAYGGTGIDAVVDVKQTSDGGYIFIGTTKSIDGDITAGKGLNDIWVVKLSATGTISWQKSFGGTKDDYAAGIEQTSDGGFVFSGSTSSTDGDVTGNHGGTDCWLVKIDNSGNLVWQKAIGGTSYDDVTAMKKTSDGGFVFVGSTSSSDGDAAGGGLHDPSGNRTDVWIVKTTDAGVISWQKAYGGDSTENGYSIAQTTDGGYIIGGITKSINGDVTGAKGNWDYWVFKISGSGTMNWGKTYGSSGQDLLKNVVPTSDGGYIITGDVGQQGGDITTSLGGGDIFTIKTDNAGDIQWVKSMGGSKGDGSGDIKQNSNDGFFMFAGFTNSNDSDVNGLHGTQSDMWVGVMYPDNSYRWKLVIGGTQSDGANKIIQTSDGGYLVAGYTRSNDGDAVNSGLHGTVSDIWLVKLSSTAGINNVTVNNNISVYPTVTYGKVHVQLPSEFENADIKLLNSTGQNIEFLSEGTGQQRTIYLSNIPTGVYVLQIITKNGIHTQKIIYQE